MASISEAQASPIELTFGDVTYQLSPLTQSNFGELERWLRQHIMDIARETAKDFNPDDRAIILKEAFTQSVAMHIGSEEAAGILRSIDGEAMTFLLVVRKNHPSMTLDKARQLLCDEIYRRRAMDAIDELNSVPEDLIPEPDKKESEDTTKGKTESQSTGEVSTGS